MNRDFRPDIAPARTDAPFRLQSAVIDLLLSGAETQMVLDEVCRLVEAEVADAVCSLMTLDDEGRALWVTSAPSLPPEAREAVDGLLPGELAGSCGTAVFTGQPAIVNDTMIDDRWADMRDFAQRFGVLAAWSVPIYAAGDRAVGSFAVSRFVPGAPTAQHRALMSTAGHIIDLVVMRAREERETSDRDQLIRAVVENADEAICVRDLESRFIYMNRAGADLLRSTPEELVGKTPRDFFSEKAWNESRESDERVISTGETLAVTFRNRWIDDVDRVTQVRKSPRFDADGKIIGVISISRDVTETDRRERAVQHARRLDSLGILAGGIAHDFNNILVGILGNSEWACERIGTDDDELRTSLREIRQAALRAKSLTARILDYAGGSAPERELTDLRELVREALQLSAGALARQVRVQLHLPDQVAGVELDPAQVQQVVMNLLVNASESFGGREGRVDVEVDECRIRTEDTLSVVGGDLAEGHYVRIRVKDEGGGMDDVTRERIFDPFFSTKDHGRGLGLASAPGILAAHDGGLRVSSVVGRGTEFELFLPVSGARTEREPRAGLPTALVVDDESFVRKTTRRLLETAGWNVITAADTVEADRLLEAGLPDLVILDVNLPGVSGIEFAETLRERYPELRFLFSTGGASDLGPESSTPVLRKPFTRDELIDAVARTQRVRI